MDNPFSRNNFDIISTIRYDHILLSSAENTRTNLHVRIDYARCPTRLYMLSYHQERMLASARAFGWNTSQIEGPGGFERLALLLRDYMYEKFHGQMYMGPLMV